MPDAMYRRIAQDLRQQIESGVLRPGARLATELELRRRYGASRNTVRDAVKWLLSRGLVDIRPGQGTFVAEATDPFITTLSTDRQADTGLGGGEGAAALRELAAGRTAAMTTPRVEIQKAQGAVAAGLGVAPDTDVISRRQERYIDGRPWSLQTTFYPMTLVRQGAWRLHVASDIEEGTIEYLRKKLGIKPAGYSDRILVRTPDETEARFFRLPDDGRVAVVVIYRTGFAENPAPPDGPTEPDEPHRPREAGELIPFRLTVSVFPADRNQFVIHWGDVAQRRTVKV
jgi:GntR family transcriptional regulator